MQYVVDKIEQVKETLLVLESGATLPCDVLVNARKPLLQPVQIPLAILDGWKIRWLEFYHSEGGGTSDVWQHCCADVHRVNAEGCEVMYQPPYLADLGLGELLQHCNRTANLALTVCYICSGHHF